MTRQISEPFFNEHPVFRREEYAAAVGRHPRDKTVTGMLSRHLSAGNVKRVGRGVFASVPKHVDAQKWVVDRFLAASRLRQNGVIAYHSALELHGYAYSEGHVVQVISEREPGLVEAASVACRFSALPKDLPEILALGAAASQPSADWDRTSQLRPLSKRLSIHSTAMIW